MGVRVPAAVFYTILLWGGWAGERTLWVAVCYQVFLDQVWKRSVTHTCCWMSPQAEDGGEEAREKAVEATTGGVTQVGKQKASRRAPGQDHGKRAIAGAAPRPSLQPVRSLLIFGCFTWERWMRFRSS